MMWTMLPLIVHCPAALKLTANPDDAVALTPKSASPYVLSASAANVIVWFAFAMLNVRATSGAAL